MYDQPSTPARDAPYPFDERSANVTLRTSDSVRFHVHTQILSQVSPFFATMFGLPQPAAPPDSPPEGPEVPLAGIRPVIHVAEDSKALEPLLRLCYPVPKPELHYLDEIQPVLAAAIKYDMESPTEELTARFIECAAQCPLQVWAFGCRYGLEHVARGGAEALRASLSRGAREGLSFLPDIPPSLQGLGGISAGQYFRLLQFVRCGGGGRERSRSESGAGSPHPRRDSDGIPLVRPPQKAAAWVPVTPCPTARPRRGVFVYITFTDGGGPPSLRHPSADVHAPDIVCRCEDGSAFAAHKHILSLRSPVLKAQLATLNAAQPSYAQLEGSSDPDPAEEREPAGALPVLTLEGPSQGITTLLCICYQSPHDPRWPGLPRTRFDCIELLAVATKYQIQPAIEIAAARWRALAHIQCHPPSPGTRGVAAMVLPTAVAAAAPPALGWCPPLRTRLDGHSRILEELPACTYHGLFVYLDACYHAAAQAFERATKGWALVAAERVGQPQAAAEPGAEPDQVARMYRVVTDGLNRRREAVERWEVAPKADHARDLRWASYSASVAGPASLRKRFKDDVGSLFAGLPKEIDDAISKVKLDLG